MSQNKPSVESYLDNPAVKSAQKLVRGRVPFKSLFIVLAVLAIILVVAIVLAANNQTVLGWIVAIIAGGWLLIATLALVFTVKAASYSKDKLSQLQSMISKQQDLAKEKNLQKSGSATGTHLVAEYASADPIRDEKLYHSFKIIQVQTQVALDNLRTDSEKAHKAVETIKNTAATGQEILNDSTQAE